MKIKTDLKDKDLLLGLKNLGFHDSIIKDLLDNKFSNQVVSLLVSAYFNLNIIVRYKGSKNYLLQYTSFENVSYVRNIIKLLPGHHNLPDFGFKDVYLNLKNSHYEWIDTRTSEKKGLYFSREKRSKTGPISEIISKKGSDKITLVINGGKKEAIEIYEKICNKVGNNKAAVVKKRESDNRWTVITNWFSYIKTFFSNLIRNKKSKKIKFQKS